MYQLNRKMSREIKMMNNKKKIAITCEENIILKAVDFILLHMWSQTSTLDLNIP